MVYPNHQLLQLSGVFDGGAGDYEIWSTGIRTVASLGSPSGGTAGETMTMEEQQEYLDYVVPVITNTLADAAFNVAGGTVKINLVKFNSIAGDGSYVYDQTTQEDLPDVPFGSPSSALSYPTQVSKVLTLETGFTRGTAARGRMYIPGPSNGFLQASGTFALGEPEVESWAAFIDSLQATITTGGRSLTVTPSVVSGIGTGFAQRPITGVSMDSRPDVQRRRANDISGTRVSAAL